jgi:hypothetical protein
MRDHALTTRGYALLQVNFVGSTGYGREYRDKLQGQWGIADIDDAIAGVNYLAKEGLIDKSRVGITGHSGELNGGLYPSLRLCLYVGSSGLIIRDPLIKNSAANLFHTGGGYATLQALATSPDVWACGVAESGISDMELLIAETHSKQASSWISFDSGRANTALQSLSPSILLHCASGQGYRLPSKKPSSRTEVQSRKLQRSRRRC